LDQANQLDLQAFLYRQPVNRIHHRHLLLFIIITQPESCCCACLCASNVLLAYSQLAVRTRKHRPYHCYYTKIDGPDVVCNDSYNGVHLIKTDIIHHTVVTFYLQPVQVRPVCGNELLEMCWDKADHCGSGI